MHKDISMVVTDLGFESTEASKTFKFYVKLLNMNDERITVYISQQEYSTLSIGDIYNVSFKLKEGK